MPEIRVGEMAPDFELEDQNGKKVKLSQYRGKKNVLLAFFPAAFSPVCTSEIGSLATQQDDIQLKLNAQILASSVDSRWVEKAFADKLGAKFPILSDFEKKAVPLYGALSEKGSAKRTVIVVDKKGKVAYFRQYEAGTMPDIDEALEVIKKLP